MPAMLSEFGHFRGNGNSGLGGFSEILDYFSGIFAGIWADSGGFGYVAVDSCGFGRRGGWGLPSAKFALPYLDVGRR